MILVDGHVHLYPTYRPHVGLNAAVDAFRRARESIPRAHGGPDCLILVDFDRAEGFRSLNEHGASGWTFSLLDDLTLRGTRSADRASLLVFAGRQLRARNGLEVLGLVMRSEVQEADSLAELARSVLDAGGLPAIPWGFGKWWGGRGGEIRELLHSELRSRIHLVDGSTRPASVLTPYPEQFRLAQRLGVPVLAGSDPLPFSGEESKIGRYGFLLDGQIDTNRPAHSLAQKIRALSASPETYGHREGLFTALRLQAAMQLRS